jgi:membrane-bound metal-dependent hydrolase YbcI (DUF457 family)
MTIPNHFALGLIIGKVTGNYILAVPISVLLDCDHFVALYKHGEMKDWKTFWKATTNSEDSYGDQRGVLHTFFAIFLTTLISYFVFSPFTALVVALSHLGHIFLDLISDADSWPFRPFSNFKVRGFVPYYSKHETVFFIGLIAIFFLI